MSQNGIPSRISTIRNRGEVLLSVDVLFTEAQEEKLQSLAKESNMSAHDFLIRTLSAALHIYGVETLAEEVNVR